MEKVQAGQELAKGVASVAREAERFIARISKQLRERAERQAETALGEYEQRIQQIVAQTREELNSRSLEVIDQIRQAILLKAEQASTSLAGGPCDCGTWILPYSPACLVRIDGAGYHRPLCV